MYWFFVGIFCEGRKSVRLVRLALLPVDALQGLDKTRPGVFARFVDSRPMWAVLCAMGRQ